SPGEIASVAKPSIWPYFRTASPGRTGAVAILCPAGTCVLARMPSTSVPGSRSARATTTLSAGLRRIVSGGMAGAFQWTKRSKRNSAASNQPQALPQFTEPPAAWQFGLLTPALSPHAGRGRGPRLRRGDGGTARPQARAGDGGGEGDRAGD